MAGIDNNPVNQPENAQAQNPVNPAVQPQDVNMQDFQPQAAQPCA
jgi:hypothetical protein